MASIRNRRPRRVSVKGTPEHDATFSSKKQADAHAQALRASPLTYGVVCSGCTSTTRLRLFHLRFGVGVQSVHEQAIPAS